MSARDDILAGLRQAEDGTVGDLTPEALLDAYRAEVRAEAAADVHRAELPTFPAGETPVNVAKVVRAVDVRLAERGAEAPYGVEQGADATPAPDFFQPGHTYTANEPFTAPELRPNFQCVAVAIHPTTGNRRALGFEQRGAGARWASSSMRDEEWADGWVVVTEGGETS